MSKERKVIYEFGPFRLEPEERRLLKHGKPVDLTPKAFNLLLVLIENPGRLLTKARLKEKVWPDSAVVEDATLTVTLRALRKALANGEKEDGEGETANGYIETVPREGYRFTAAVTRIEQSETESQTAAPRPPVPVFTLTEKTIRGDGSKSAGTANGKVKRKAWKQVALLGAVVIAAAAIIGAVIPQTPPTVTAYKPLTQGGHDVGEVFSTDGVRVYFQEIVGAKGLIGAVPLNGSGSPVYLDIPFKLPVLYGIFPRGEALLIGDGWPSSTFWKLRVPGIPQPLPNMHGVGIALSPDGERYAQIEDQRRLIISNLDGSTATTIFSAPDATLALAQWSPNGKSLCFTRLDPEADKGADLFSLWVINADGSRPQKVVSSGNGTEVVSFCNWTPDGRYLLYTGRSNVKADLWALENHVWWKPFAHPKPIRLTNNPVEFLAPFASPDGKKILAMGQVQRAELVRYDRKTKTWLPFLDGMPVESVDISRDGEWITYVKFTEQTLWTSRIDGSNPKQLTFAPLIADTPHWSPDGKRIAFRLYLPGQPAEIHLISRDGGVPQPLIPRDTEEEGTPTWSADGKQITFGRLRYHPEKIEVNIIDLETRKLETVPGSRGLWSPRWSPSGRYLMAMSAEGAYFNSKRLLVFDFRTKRWKKLLDNNALEEPVWSPDERYIYFVAATPERVLFRVKVSDGKVERIESLAGFPELGTWLGMAPDDSPVIVREIRLMDLYALDVKW